MVFVVTIGGGIAVFAVLTERNDRVVRVIAVLLIETRIHNSGNQRTAACAQQIVHHLQEGLLIDLQVRDRRLRPDDELRFAHHLFSGVGVDFQRVQQLILIPFQGLRDIALDQRNLRGARGLQRKPLDITQREGQSKQD